MMVIVPVHEKAGGHVRTLTRSKAAAISHVPALNPPWDGQSIKNGSVGQPKAVRDDDKAEKLTVT